MTNKQEKSECCGVDIKVITTDPKRVGLLGSFVQDGIVKIICTSCLKNCAVKKEEECGMSIGQPTSDSFLPCKNTKPCKLHSSSMKDHSHYHCWEQTERIKDLGTPACGQSLKSHKQCCLCDTPVPNSSEEKLIKCKVCGLSCWVENECTVKPESTLETRWVKEYYRIGDLTAGQSQEILAFLQKEISNARAEVIKETREEVENLAKNYHKKDTLDGNEAIRLEDVLSIINKQK